MNWKRNPKVGDRVHIKAFRALPAFDGTIEELISPRTFNVRSDTDGKLWFRSDEEASLLDREAAE